MTTERTLKTWAPDAPWRDADPPRTPTPEPKGYDAAKVERLTRKLDAGSENLGLCADEANRLRAEVERLRAEVAALLSALEEPPT